MKIFEEKVFLRTNIFETERLFDENISQMKDCFETSEISNNGLIITFCKFNIDFF